LTDLLLSTSTHLSHYSTFVEGMKGLKPGETCLTAWVKTTAACGGFFSVTAANAANAFSM